MPRRTSAYLLSYGQMYAIANILRQTLNDVGFEAARRGVLQRHAGDGHHRLLRPFDDDERHGRRSRAAPGADPPGAVNADGQIEFVVIEDFFELPDTRPPAE